MIGYLSGILKSVSPRGALIDVGGVGYLVFMNAGDLSRARVGASAEVYCYTNVREDALQLFGFFSEDARDFFEVLISVSGVGPKSGLLILSVGTVEEVRTAIEQGDVKFLTSVPGVGKKIAERIILELRGKMPEAAAEVVGSEHGMAIEALVNLGYRKEDAAAILRGKSGGTEELIRYGLKNLSRH